MRGSRGFTFIEAVIVAVLSAILAAVAIPLYKGFIDNQRKSVVKGLAETASVSANIFYRRHGRTPTVAELKLFLPNQDRFSIVVNASHVKVYDTTVSPAIGDSARYN